MARVSGRNRGHLPRAEHAVRRFRLVAGHDRRDPGANRHADATDLGRAIGRSRLLERLALRHAGSGHWPDVSRPGPAGFDRVSSPGRQSDRPGRLRFSRPVAPTRRKMGAREQAQAAQHGHRPTAGRARGVPRADWHLRCLVSSETGAVAANRRRAEGGRQADRPERRLSGLGRCGRGRLRPGAVDSAARYIRPLPPSARARPPR